MVQRACTFLLAATLLAISFSPDVADAQERQASNSSVELGGLTLWGIIAQHRTDAGLGVGVHYMVPIGDGILGETPVQDRFALEFGVDLTSHFLRHDTGGYLRLRPAVGFLWTIWVIDELALYPKIDIGLPFVFGRDYWNWWLINGAFGLLYRLDDFDLRVEAGWYGLHIGALFRF